VSSGATRRCTSCTDGGFAPSRTVPQMHEARPQSDAIRVNSRFRGAQPAQPASTAENPSLSAAAPSLYVAVRRWHPSVLARSARCAPPTSPKSDARGRSGRCARMGEVVIGRPALPAWVQLYACFRMRALRLSFCSRSPPASASGRACERAHASCHARH